MEPNRGWVLRNPGSGFEGTQVLGSMEPNPGFRRTQAWVRRTQHTWVPRTQGKQGKERKKKGIVGFDSTQVGYSSLADIEKQLHPLLNWSLYVLTTASWMKWTWE
ncbi:hypothetical protein SLEP1_g40309 [Rubroshorea leprosula]|uniref:Uncharacterized protein n=1 Tax=Rubroshorea leprosula TaxID=152421 RepID=A0AAV5L3D4_9ROSI|nr:hypothetical protein SLEP1_g40309 [Rubroshorea leprosula]